VTEPVPLVLAGGSARRFGSDKRLALLPSGRGLLETTVAHYLGALGRCVVVIDGADRALGAALRAQGADLALVAGARSGRAGSGLGDSPGVAVETILAVAGALGRHELVIPSWRGRWGHPVGFSGALLPALEGLRGDRGARDLLLEYASRRLELAVDDPGVVLDVDVPADLDRFVSGIRVPLDGCPRERVK
jgi:molybdenum cofactor cytidylyltransferase